MKLPLLSGRPTQTHATQHSRILCTVLWEPRAHTAMHSSYYDRRGPSAPALTVRGCECKPSRCRASRMPRDTCGTLPASFQDPDTCWSLKGLAAVLKRLTLGDLAIVLLQLNAQLQRRPWGHLHHLWTQNHHPRGLCCKQAECGSSDLPSQDLHPGPGALPCGPAGASVRGGSY